MDLFLGSVEIFFRILAASELNGSRQKIAHEFTTVGTPRDCTSDSVSSEYACFILCWNNTQLIKTSTAAKISIVITNPDQSLAMGGDSQTRFRIVLPLPPESDCSCRFIIL